MKKINSRRKYKRTPNNRVFIIMAVFQLLCLTSSLSGQKIKGGDAIENFSLKDVSGIQCEYKGFQPKKVVLAFFRYTGSLISNFRIHELRKEYSQVILDIFEIIVVFALKFYKQIDIERIIGKPLKTIFKKKTIEAKVAKNQISSLIIIE